MSDKELEPQINDEVENEFVEADSAQVDPAAEVETELTEAPAEDADDAEVSDVEADEADAETSDEEAEVEEDGETKVARLKEEFRSKAHACQVTGLLFTPTLVTKTA